MHCVLHKEVIDSHLLNLCEWNELIRGRKCSFSSLEYFYNQVDEHKCEFLTYMPINGSRRTTETQFPTAYQKSWNAVFFFITSI